MSGTLRLLVRVWGNALSRKKNVFTFVNLKKILRSSGQCQFSMTRVGSSSILGPILVIPKTLQMLPTASLSSLGHKEIDFGDIPARDGHPLHEKQFS